MIDPYTLEVKIHRNQTVNALFSLLSEQNINVVSFRNKTNRLEEMFLQLTK